MRDYTDEELQRFSTAIERLSGQAGSKVWEVFNRLGFYGADEMAEAALIDAMCLAIEQYGAAVGTAIGEWVELGYVDGDAIDPKALVMREAALEALAEVEAVNRSKVASYVRKSMRFAGESKAARAAAGRQAAAYAAAEAKRRGYTIFQGTLERAEASAKQLGMSPMGLMVIWKPNSPRPCAFCTMLASNSWRVAQKKTIGSYRDHVHPHCSCTLIFRPPDSAVEGVTPKKYLERLTSVVHVDEAGNEYVVTAKGRKIYHYEASGYVSTGYWEEVRHALARKDYAEPAVGDRLREMHREQYARTHPKKDRDE